MDQNRCKFIRYLSHRIIAISVQLSMENRIELVLAQFNWPLTAIPLPFQLIGVREYSLNNTHNMTNYIALNFGDGIK